MPHEIATRRVLYEIAGMQSIQPREFTFTGADGESLPGRIYSTNRARGVVVIIEGYPDPGFVQHVGCRFMDMQWSISLAQLIAASGLAAITYANRQPAADALTLFDHLTTNSSRLGIDGSRLALWATSGHGPVAISLLSRVSCAVLSNPITDVRLREDASTFAPGASADRSARQAEIPIFVVRSGKDETPGLNASLDRFIANALAENRPITVVNHAAAPHSFELNHDSSTTRQIIRQALEFLDDWLHTSGG